jgi:hypothetical protein
LLVQRGVIGGALRLAFLVEHPEGRAFVL